MKTVYAFLLLSFLISLNVFAIEVKRVSLEYKYNYWRLYYGAEVLPASEKVADVISTLEKTHVLNCAVKGWQNHQDAPIVIFEIKDCVKEKNL